MKKHYLVLTLFSIYLIISPIADHREHLKADESEYYLKIKKGLSYFQKVYERVQSHYVEEIDPYEFVKAGIEGMLSNLDPYTVFIEEDDDARLRIITTGKYGGLGMEIGMRNDKITVISPLDNSPAQKAGIRAGDIIKMIEDDEVADLPPEKISKRLRGPIGTVVEITIERPGFEHDITVNIKREEIVIKDVSFFDFVGPGVAYVRLTGFTDKAGSEMRNAIKMLKQRNEINAFILDLRGNSGGLLESAVEVAGLFLAPKTMVVSTKGFRDGENAFRTKSEPLLPDVPLAVLVDQGSASASEIVAGALQDLDRAIIVGTRSFGKGLVQKVYNIDKNSSTKIKVTTAKYYIPSGRCVQKEDYTDNKSIFYDQIIDSLALNEENLPFYTTNNRPVFENGGISPDRVVENEKVHYVVTELWRKSLPFNFAVEYHQQHPEWVGNDKISDSIFNEFLTYVENNNFQYEIEGEAELLKFSEKANDNNYNKEIMQRTENLIDELVRMKKQDLVNHKTEICTLLQNEFTEKYYGSNEKIRYSLRDDIQLNMAIDVLLDNSEYKKILAIN